jgi:beta-galactosidase
MKDFPAAGLLWMTPFVVGKNHLHVVAESHGKTVTDEIEFIYQTEEWGPPAQFRVKEIARSTLDGHETVAVEVTLHDANGIQCLAAKNQIRYSIAGAGTLIDNRGMSSGPRVVHLCNGPVPHKTNLQQRPFHHRGCHSRGSGGVLHSRLSGCK